MWADSENEEVHYDKIVMGYEVGKGQQIVATYEKLEAISIDLALS